MSLRRLLRRRPLPRGCGLVDLQPLLLAGLRRGRGVERAGEQRHARRRASRAATRSRRAAPRAARTSAASSKRRSSRSTPSSIPSRRCETERRRRVSRSRSAAEGRLSALIAVSCAAVAFSRASKARESAPVTIGFSSRSCASLPRASSPDRASRSRRLALPVSSSIAAPFYRGLLWSRNVPQSRRRADQIPQGKIEGWRSQGNHIDPPPVVFPFPRHHDAPLSVAQIEPATITRYGAATPQARGNRRTGVNGADTAREGLAPAYETSDAAHRACRRRPVRGGGRPCLGGAAPPGGDADERPERGAHGRRPAGASVKRRRAAPLPAPVDSVVDLGPVATPTPTPTATATPDATPAPSVTATPTPGNIGSGDNVGARRGGSGGGIRATSSGGGKPKPGKVVGGATATAQVRQGKLDENLKPRQEVEGTKRRPRRRQPDAEHRRLADAREPDRLARRRPAPPASASRTSSSTSSGSRPSSSRSTRPPASSTACAGRSWRRSTRSRPTTAATSTSPRPARVGWMQFMPSTWEIYGVDANQDGSKDPYNPVDAIFAAARYLKAAGAEKDLRARDLRLQPRRLVRRLGAPARAPDRRPARRPRRLAHRPDAGPLPGAGEGHVRERGQARRPQRRQGHNAAYVVDSDGRAQRHPIFAKKGAPVVAVNDGRIVDDRPHPPPRQLREAPGRLRQHVHVRAPRLGRPSATRRPSPHGHRAREARRAQAPAARRRPRRPGLDDQRARRPPSARRARGQDARDGAPRAETADPTGLPAKQRLFAHPERPRAAAAGGEQQADRARREDFGAYLNRVFGLDRSDVDMKPLEQGRARHGRHRARPHRQASSAAPPPHLLFEIRPAGKRRAADRPEADPRRLEAARVDRDLPRRRPQPVRRQGRRQRRPSARSC